MQPYMNPNYLNQYQMPMYQQPIPMQNNAGSGTRFVNSFSDIQISEIPMDGTYKLFAKQDMSEIQAKAWDSNGTIKTISFSPIKAIETEKADELPTIDLSLQFEPILAEIKALNDKIDKLSKNTNRSGKKEVVSDES